MVSSFDVINLAAVTAQALFLGYAAYWALDIRHALAVRLYRNQALGIGLISLVLSLNVVVGTAQAYVVHKDPTSAATNGAYGAFFLLLILIFYWTDASARAARRSDPLLRDTLHWSIARIPLWIAVLPMSIIVLIVNIASLFFSGGNTGSAPTYLFLPLFASIVIPPLAAAILLPVVASRSGDKTMRSHLKWFGLFGGSTIIFQFFLRAPLTNPVQILAMTYAGTFVSGYCLYRSARSLVPLNRISIEP